MRFRFLRAATFGEEIGCRKRSLETDLSNRLVLIMKNLHDRPPFHGNIAADMADNTDKILKVGLPKGSLSEPTLDLFEKAGYNIHGASRSYRPSIDDPELQIRLIRAQEIGRYVDHGFLDCGITGMDWIAENGADVEVVCDLRYSKATSKPTRWVLVVPNDSPIQSVKDLEGKRIAAEAIGIVEKYLKENGVNAEVEFSWGATEVKVPELVDAIVDITETGSSLRANNLRIVDVLMESYPQFVAKKESWQDPWKRSKDRAACRFAERRPDRSRHGRPEDELAGRPPRSHSRSASFSEKANHREIDSRGLAGRRNRVDRITGPRVDPPAQGTRRGRNHRIPLE